MNTTTRSLLAVALLCGAAFAGEPDPGAFLRYYEPVQIDIEPNAPGYTLPLDVSEIVNYKDVIASLGLPDVTDQIQQQGFAIVEHDFNPLDPNRDDMVAPYQYLGDREIPLFVTSDTWLHLYHVQFDETLRQIEEDEFIPDLVAMTSAMRVAMTSLHDQLDGDLQEAAKRNIAFLAVAEKLLVPDWDVPAMVAEAVGLELAAIEAHQGFSPSEIFFLSPNISMLSFTIPPQHARRTGIQTPVRRRGSAWARM